jgi:hypothetical protein
LEAFLNESPDRLLLLPIMPTVSMVSNFWSQDFGEYLADSSPTVIRSAGSVVEGGQFLIEVAGGIRL